MRRIFLIITVFVAATLYTSAQYVDQALLFSQQSYGTTARSKAMGGAFGAIGGDFSSLSINPAGIGIYRTSEWSISPTAVYLNKTQTSGGSNVTDDTKYNFNLKNIGYISTYNFTDAGSLTSFNFGFGLNRLNNFNQNSLFRNNGSKHSYTDYLVQETNGIDYKAIKATEKYDPFSSGLPWKSILGYNNGIIERYRVSNDSLANNLYQSILEEGQLVNQNYSEERKGYIYEYLFSGGVNISHILYLGATVSMQDLLYQYTVKYSENWGDNNFEYIDYLRTSGLGFNLKIGAILRPVPQLRLGVAYHTPTFYNMEEDYRSSMNSYFAKDKEPYFNMDSPKGEYSYKMETPARIIASAAFQLGKRAMLSADYEYVDYSSIKLRKGADGYGFKNENDDITSIYRSTNIFRFGAEFRAFKDISLRGGYELYGNPYRSVLNIEGKDIPQPNADFSNVVYTGGIGFRFQNGSFDIAYSRAERRNYSFIYQLDNVDVAPVKYKSTINELIFSLIFKF